MPLQTAFGWHVSSGGIMELINRTRAPVESSTTNAAIALWLKRLYSGGRHDEFYC